MLTSVFQTFLALLSVLNGVQPGVTRRDCGDCPEMVSLTSAPDPVLRRLIVGRYEVTWREYLTAVEEANCPAPRNLDGPLPSRDLSHLRDGYPITSISADDFDCFLRWMRRKTGKSYRLHTEAEWEAIARAATALASLPAGRLGEKDGYLLNRLNADKVDGDLRRAVHERIVQPVGRTRPNSPGLYDLFGNAAEAVSDAVNATDLSPNAKPFPLVIAKGGHIGSRPDFDLINAKNRFGRSVVSEVVGFRVAFEE